MRKSYSQVMVGLAGLVLAFNIHAQTTQNPQQQQGNISCKKTAANVVTCTKGHETWKMQISDPLMIFSKGGTFRAMSWNISCPDMFKTASVLRMIKADWARAETALRLQMANPPACGGYCPQGHISELFSNLVSTTCDEVTPVTVDPDYWGDEGSSDASGGGDNSDNVDEVGIVDAGTDSTSGDDTGTTSTDESDGWASSESDDWN